MGIIRLLTLSLFHKTQLFYGRIFQGNFSSDCLLLLFIGFSGLGDFFLEGGCLVWGLFCLFWFCFFGCCFFFPKQEIIKHSGHNIYLNNKDYEIGHFYFIISPVIYIVIQFYTLFQAESTSMTPQKMKQFGHLNLNRILLDKITYNQ